MKTILIVAALALTGCATDQHANYQYTPEERAAAIGAILSRPQPQPYFIPPNAVSQPIYRAPVQRTVICHRVGGVVQCF